MAPDAEKTKMRMAATDDHAELTVAAATVDSLGSDEVAIDGDVYSLNGFAHPGGDQIRLFGGNDVTVQYRMIHPRHTPKHLSKMTFVRKIKGKECEYKFDTPFERELKEEVFKIVHRGKEFGTLGYFIRATFYVGLYFACLFLWISKPSTFLLAGIFGFSKALIGLNVQHDANHGAASRNPAVNDLLGFGVDLLGGSKWLWMQQHWTHHAYTNHQEKDPDAISSEPFLLLKDYPPNHASRKWYHKFQILWALPILCLYWLSIVLSTAVLDLKHPGAVAVGVNLDNDFLRTRAKFAVLSRVLYVLLIIVPPFYHHGIGLKPFLQINFMGAVGSMVLSMLFIISHNFESVERSPTQSGTKVCWYKSQVETSSTYGGFVAGCLTGGLNFQVEHHLFPRMSSAWYPYIAPTVRKVCAKHGVKYTYYPWLWQNIWAAAKHIHANGTASHPTSKND